MWNNPIYPEGAVRTELHISGTENTCDYLHDMIEEIAEPFDVSFSSGRHHHDLHIN